MIDLSALFMKYWLQKKWLQQVAAFPEIRP